MPTPIRISLTRSLLPDPGEYHISEEDMFAQEKALEEAAKDIKPVQMSKIAQAKDYGLARGRETKAAYSGYRTVPSNTAPYSYCALGSRTDIADSEAQTLEFVQSVLQIARQQGPRRWGDYEQDRRIYTEWARPPYETGALVQGTQGVFRLEGFDRGFFDNLAALDGAVAIHYAVVTLFGHNPTISAQSPYSVLRNPAVRMLQIAGSYSPVAELLRELVATTILANGTSEQYIATMGDFQGGAMAQAAGALFQSMGVSTSDLNIDIVDLFDR